MHTLLSLVIDFVISFVSGFIIVYIIALIISKRKNISSSVYLKRVFIIVLIFSCLATISPLLNALQSSRNIANYNINNISPVDKNRIQVIIQNTVQNKDYLTPEVQNEFWTILDKYGKLSPTDITNLRDIFTGISNKYMHLYYQDALVSLQTGKPFKSSERDAYEKHLISLGFDESQIKNNDSMMGKIAKQEPIDSQGKSIVFTSDIINSILANLDDASKRLDTLFTRIQQ